MSQLQRLTVAPEQIAAEQITLSGEQQHYLSRVLRLRSGDRFIAMTGQGQSWIAQLATPATAQLLEPIAVHTELPIAVTLLVALPKTGLDDIVRQATELGVDQIVPILSDRTLLNPSPAKLDRWQRIAQEAAEQCERPIVPRLSPPCSWPEALQLHNSTHSTCFLCEARGNHPHLLHALTLPLPCRDPNSPISTAITLATGPEGGWTEAEIAQAIAAGYQPISLGKRILRAVTAPLVALSLVASVFEVMPETQKSV